MTEKEIYETALKEFGIEMQRLVLFEEVGELMQAISKFHRDLPNDLATISQLQNIFEEIADVQIMLEQMIIFYTKLLKLQNYERKYNFKKIKKQKLQKLENHLIDLKS